MASAEIFVTGRMNIHHSSRFIATAIASSTPSSEPMKWWNASSADWPGLRSIAVVESQRELLGQTSGERRYYISSLSGTDAQAMAAAIRGHWGIENRLHWQLDVSFNEDQCRVRKGHAAENLSRLRRMALNLLKQEKSVKVGIKAKRLKAGWNHDYLLKVLQVPRAGE